MAATHDPLARDTILFPRLSLGEPRRPWGNPTARFVRDPRHLSRVSRRDDGSSLRSWLMFYVGTFSPQRPTASCQRATPMYQTREFGGSGETRLATGSTGSATG